MPGDRTTPYRFEGAECRAGPDERATAGGLCRSGGTIMMKSKTATAALGFLLAFGQAGWSSDLPTKAPAAAPVAQSGIWGAIAYSRTDGKHGFFWGADKRREAEETAFKYCENAGGKSCSVVTVFRNHRHWDDDDGSGFPYNHCAALAVDAQASPLSPANASTPWAAASATTRKAAEDKALSKCDARGSTCKIREWVCT